MQTFDEIATEARLIATSQRPGTIDYARMIARLAEAMAVLEYNTAQALAQASSLAMGMPGDCYFNMLRQPIPTEKKDTP